MEHGTEGGQRRLTELVCASERPRSMGCGLRLAAQWLFSGDITAWRHYSHVTREGLPRSG